MRREWIEILSENKRRYTECGLPPCGGSGLKSVRNFCHKTAIQSPSMRREWIEMPYSVGRSV